MDIKKDNYYENRKQRRKEYLDLMLKTKYTNTIRRIKEDVVEYKKRGQNVGQEKQS